MGTPAYQQNKAKTYSITQKDMNNLSSLLRDANLQLALIITDDTPDSNDAYKHLDETLFRIRQIISTYYGQ